MEWRGGVEGGGMEGWSIVEWRGVVERRGRVERGGAEG